MSIAAATYNEARKARIAAENAGGGSERILVFREVVTESKVLTIPAGEYDIIAIGTGGSGGRAAGTYGRATGGGGPAYARDWGTNAAPTAITITIGARALGVTSGTGAANGNDGGTTTVTGIEDPITLTGGSKGNAAINTTTTVLGGLGGIASGGKIRSNGGRGGDIATTSIGFKATGGGAVDLFLKGTNKTRGGDFVAASTETSPLGTGGAGVGGRGGDIVAALSVSTPGGGAGGDALDATGASNAGPNIVGVRGAGIAPTDAEAVDILLSYPGLRPTSSGGSDGTAPLPGGGAGGYNGSGVTVPFGASGGITGTTGGASEIGGGSGGVSPNTQGASTSGNGGKAIVIVSVYAKVTA